MVRVDENHEMDQDTSPPPTPIDITSMVLALNPEVEEASTLVSTKVRAKKYDYKNIIAQQSELIAQLKRCLTQLCDKSAEVQQKTSEVQAGANSKVQKLFSEKQPMRHEILHLTNEVKALRVQSAEHESQASELKAQLDATRSAHAADKAALHAATARLESTEQELCAERDKAVRAQAELAAATERLAQAETAHQELEDKLRIAGVEHKKQLATLRESIDRRTEKLAADYDAQLAELGTAHAEAVVRGEGLATELETAVADRDGLRARLEVAEAARARADQELTATTAEARRLRDEVAKKDADLSESLRNINQLQSEAIERQSELREEKRRLSDDLVATRARAEALDAAAVREGRERTVLVAELAAADAAEASARSAFADADRGRVEAAEGLLRAQADLTALRQDHARVSQALDEASAARDGLAGRVEALTASEEELGRASAEAKAQLRDLEVEFRTYKTHCGTSSNDQMAALVRLQQECESLSAKFEETRGQLGKREGETNALHVDLERRAAQVADLENKLQEAEATRRKLHNMCQELKGNIRVFCRVRPPQPAGGDLGPSCLTLHADGSQVEIATTSGGDKGTREASHSFAFDRVFSPVAAQEEVFDEVSGLVQSALDGYKVCIFAYGQTGSGKTFTMQGTADQVNAGIVPRSLRQVFDATQRAVAKGWTYTLEASFVEVYNEAIRDLLAPPGDQAQGLGVKHDEAFGTVVAEAVRVPVASPEHIDDLAHMAACQRSVGATDMNAVSSRSHAIFMLYLTGE